MLSPATIAERLSDQFALLTRGNSTSLPQQQTLLAMMDWSYALLSDVEKRLFVQLAVFTGGWDIDAAEAVCADEAIPHNRVLTLLSELVDKSLVFSAQRNADRRFFFLETVRHYAQQRLDKESDAMVLYERHQHYFFEMAWRGEEGLGTSEQDVWLKRLDTEHDNLRAAIDRSVFGSDSAADCLIAVGALSRYWHIRGLFAEGRERLGQVLKMVEDQPPSAPQAKALSRAAYLAYSQGDSLTARRLYDESLAVCSAIGDERARANTLSNYGLLTANLGENDKAMEMYEESLGIRRRLEDRSGIAVSLNNLGLLSAQTGDYERAWKWHQESLALERECGDKQGIARSLNNLADIAWRQGDYVRAEALWHDSLSLFEEIGDRNSYSLALKNLGNAKMSMGYYADAHKAFSRALDEFSQIGNVGRTLSLLCNIAELFQREGGHLVQAGMLLGCVDAAWQRISMTPPSDQDEHADMVSAVRDTLGVAQFDLAWKEGSRMQMAEAVRLVQQIL
jgi:non-specific serine/threonine protein kinase